MSAAGRAGKHAAMILPLLAFLLCSCDRYDIPAEGYRAGIDILVLYTPDAGSAMAAEGQDVDTYAQHLVDTTNRVFDSSSVSHRLYLAGVEEASLSESEILAAEGETDYSLHTIHDWLTDQVRYFSTDEGDAREAAQADIVMMLVSDDTEDASGVARVTEGSSSNDYFKPCGVAYWPGEMTFAHEVGHLFGGEHDAYEMASRSDTPHNPIAQGWVDMSIYAYTLMSYPDECIDDGVSCQPVGVLSNPSVTIDGAPMGDASSAFNACMVEMMGPYLEMFYEYWWDPKSYEWEEYTMPEYCEYDMDHPDVFCASPGTVSTDADLSGCADCTILYGPLTLSEGITDAGLTYLANLTWVQSDMYTGNFSIESSSITSLASLANLEQVDGGLRIAGTGLASLSGLSSLEDVGGSLEIESNASLTTMADLSGLESVGEGVSIINNDALLEVDGPGALEIVPGDLTVMGQAVAANVSGFASITRIGGNLTISINDQLETLDGLAALEDVGGSIGIGLNPELDDCELDSLDEADASAASLVSNGDGCAGL